MDQISGKAAMRFLSFENDKEDAEKKAKLNEAAAKIEQAIARAKSLDELIDYEQPADEVADLTNDTRPLYERLLEQRNKKKEAIEDSQKFSNLVTKLDEDDVNYLNDVARIKQEEEIKKRLEIYDALEEKKKVNDRKINEDEKKMKETLIGSRSGDRGSSSSLRSKFSSLIKVKPKLKTTPMSSNKDHTMSPMLEGVNEPQRQAKLNIQTDDAPESSDHNSSVDSGKSEKGLKRKRMDSSGIGLPNEEKKDDIGMISKEDCKDCACPPRDIMQCIGILPSLPLVNEFRDSSENSDDSADNLSVRIVPRVGRRRRHYK